MGCLQTPRWDQSCRSVHSDSETMKITLRPLSLINTTIIIRNYFRVSSCSDTLGFKKLQLRWYGKKLTMQKRSHQLRTERQIHHLQIESQSDEFQHSRAEWRATFGTIKQRRRAVQDLTGKPTARAGIAPEVIHPRAREAQLHHRSLDASKSRDGVSNTVAKSPPGACSGQCSYESNSDHKQFDDHKKPRVDAAQLHTLNIEI